MTNMENSLATVRIASGVPMAVRADIVVCRCEKTRNLYGMRVEEKSPGHWSATWAFPLRQDRIDSEGYGSALIQGKFSFAEGFPGCPSCQASSFALCNVCHRVGCSAANAAYFTCPWCSNAGPLAGTITELQGGGDR